MLLKLNMSLLIAVERTAVISTTYWVIVTNFFLLDRRAYPVCSPKRANVIPVSQLATGEQQLSNAETVLNTRFTKMTIFCHCLSKRLIFIALLISSSFPSAIVFFVFLLMTTEDIKFIRIQD